MQDTVKQHIIDSAKQFSTKIYVCHANNIINM